MYLYLSHTRTVSISLHHQRANTDTTINGYRTVRKNMHKLCDVTSRSRIDPGESSRQAADDANLAGTLTFRCTEQCPNLGQLVRVHHCKQHRRNGVDNVKRTAPPRTHESTHRETRSTHKTHPPGTSDTSKLTSSPRQALRREGGRPDPETTGRPERSFPVPKVARCQPPCGRKT